MRSKAKDPVKKILRAEQAVNRLERNLALEKIKKRKADTRQKIELGGLVIKAKMNQYPKDVILGALLSTCEDLAQDRAMERVFAKKGKAYF